MLLASSTRWATVRQPAIYIFNLFLLIAFGLSWAPTPGAAAYRILVLSVNGKSHAYAMTAIAGGLADRGHDVTIVVGESMPLDEPEAAIARRPRVVVERFKDDTKEHDAVYENITSMAIANRMDLKEMLPMITTMYALFAHFFASVSDTVGATISSVHCSMPQHSTRFAEFARKKLNHTTFHARIFSARSRKIESFFLNG